MPKTTGTGYTNIQDYLSANQNNNLGGVLSGGIQSAVDQAQQGLSKQQTQFDSTLGQTDQSLQQGVSNSNTLASNLVNNPTGIGSKDISGYQSFVNTPYNGPSGLADTTKVQADARNVSTLGNLAGNQGGRSELLRSFLNTPNYTSTQQTLDSILLGNDVDKQLQPVVQNAQQFSNNAQQTQNNAAFKAQLEQANMGKAQSSAKDTFNTYGTQYNTNLNNAVTSAQKNASDFNTLYNQAQNDPTAERAFLAKYAPGYLSTFDQAQSLGQGKNYWTGLASNATLSNPNAASLVNTDQKAQAQAQALAQILGSDVVANLASTPAYNPSTVQFNASAANQNVNNMVDPMNLTLDKLASMYTKSGSNPYQAALDAINSQAQVASGAVVDQPTAQMTLAQLAKYAGGQAPLINVQARQGGMMMSPSSKTLNVPTVVAGQIVPSSSSTVDPSLMNAIQAALSSGQAFRSAFVGASNGPSSASVLAPSLQSLLTSIS